MKNRFYILIALIFTVLVAVSCDKKQDSTVLERDFQGEIWHRFDFIEAKYNVVKAPMTADLVIELTVSDVYPNIYPTHGDEGLFSITMSISGPDGSERVRDYKVKLKDSEGNFKSQKTDGYFCYELPMISGMSFSEAGEYEFKIENKYSKEPLYGIKRLKISCLQN